MPFQPVRGFFNGLAQRRVRMDVAGDLARRQLGEPGQRQLRQKFSHVRADHLGAEHLTVFFVADQFDEACRVAQSLSFAVRREWELGDVDVMASLARLFLSVTKAGDLRLAVSGSRHHVEFQLDGFSARDVFGRNDAHRLGHVREHQFGGDVADGVDVWNVGLHLAVDLNRAALGQPDVGLFQAVTFDARFEADGLQNLVGFERLLFAVRRGDGDAHVQACVFDVVYTRSGHNLDAVAAELAAQLRRHLFVLQRRDAIEKLHDGHVYAVAVEYVSELDADGARARDDNAPREMVFHDLLFVSDYALAQLRAGNQPSCRSRGDDAVFKPDGLFAARVQLHVQRMRIGECRPAFVFVNLVLFHQVADAFDAAVGHLAASAERFSVIETDASFDVDAEGLGFVFEDVNQLRVAEQRLGWNATDVEADAAPILFFYDGCLQPELFGADGRNVTSRPCAQHDNIVLFRH